MFPVSFACFGTLASLLNKSVFLRMTVSTVVQSDDLLNTEFNLGDIHLRLRVINLHKAVDDLTRQVDVLLKVAAHG